MGISASSSSSSTIPRFLELRAASIRAALFRRFRRRRLKSSARTTRRATTNRTPTTIPAIADPGTEVRVSVGKADKVVGTRVENYKGVVKLPSHKKNTRW